LGDHVQPDPRAPQQALDIGWVRIGNLHLDVGADDGSSGPELGTANASRDR
jgi:hypothetical protein